MERREIEPKGSFFEMIERIAGLIRKKDHKIVKSDSVPGRMGIVLKEPPLVGEESYYDCRFRFPSADAMLGSQADMGLGDRRTTEHGTVLQIAEKPEQEQAAQEINQSLSTLTQLANDGNSSDPEQRALYQENAALVLKHVASEFISDAQKADPEIFSRGDMLFVFPLGGGLFPQAVVELAMEDSGIAPNEYMRACIETKRIVTPKGKVYIGGRLGNIPSLFGRVLLVDDTFATGSTARATMQILRNWAERYGDSVIFKAPHAIGLAATRYAMQAFHNNTKPNSVENGGQMYVGGLFPIIDGKGAMRTEDGRLGVGNVKDWTRLVPEDNTEVGRKRREIVDRWNRLGHWPPFTICQG